ncbi:hypothetical protein [Marasmitruncus massiliensis]|uniref:hypothetical protein n=1 Tax=Marasmitruncus massiliensis TaxID=1944642 RepID=UPI0011AF89CD|nr:hypothetical protein [Marasmitruncus massiliensis]
MLTFGCALSLKAQAEPFLDECDSLNQSAEKSYVNFIQNIDDFSAYSGWSSCGDNTIFSMAANKSWVDYHVKNASELYVELYSDGGTFATVADTGALQIGLTKMNQLSNMYRCKYQRPQDKVYLYLDSQIYSLKCDQYALSFIQDSGNFEDDDPYYGANAEISQDGLTYSPIQLNFDRVLWQNRENYGNYFREFYSASLPEETNYVRLTLYGYNRLPGGWSDLPNYPMLSRVVITRNEPAVPSEPPNEDSSSSPELSSAPESTVSNKTHSDDDNDSTESQRLIRSKNAEIDHSSGEESLPMKESIGNSVQKNIEYFPAQASSSSGVTSKDLQLSVPLSGQDTLQEPDQKRLPLYQDKAEQTGKTFENFLMPVLILLQIVAAIFFLKPQ